MSDDSLALVALDWYDKHGDKKYTFAVNGQTGKVVGKLPMNKLKLFLLGGGAFLLTDLVFILGSLFG